MSSQFTMSSAVVELQPQAAHGAQEPVPPPVSCGLSMGTLGGTVNVQVPDSPETLTTVFEPETADSGDIGWYVGAEPDLAGVVYTDSSIYRLVVTVSDVSSTAQYRVSVSGFGRATHRLVYTSGEHSSDLIVVNQKESSTRTTPVVVYSRAGGSWAEFFSGEILISALTEDPQGVRELVIPGP